MAGYDRRDFLALSGLGLSGLALAKLTGCSSDESGPVLADLDPPLPANVPASLLSASDAELDIELSVLSGALPGDVHGHVFVNTPLPQGGGAHVFNGEAMLFRIDFGDARVKVKSRILRTPDYYLDQATSGGDHGFRNIGIARMSGDLGFRVMPNTTPLSLGPDRMLAAVDASRPWELDPVSLELVTPMGALSEWTTALPPGLFTGPFQPVFTPAHPFFDEHTGETFTANYTLAFPGATPYSAIVRWDGSGALDVFPMVLSNGDPVAFAQTGHQVTATRDYILIIDTAFLTEAEQQIGMDVSRPQSPDTVIYVVSRADLVAGGGQVEARKIVIGREAAHVVADYDNPNGQLTLHMAHMCATDLSEWLRDGDVRADNGQPVRPDLYGMFNGGVDRNYLGKHVVDAATGAVIESSLMSDDQLTWATLLYMHRGQMPHARFGSMYYASFGFHAELVTQRAVDLYADYPHRTVPIADLPYADGRPGSLVRLDTASMQIADGFAMPPGRVLSSPQFAPRPGTTGDTDGYMVCTVASDDADELWIFDAANLGQGPVCRLGAPELDFGFTIHTTWTESIAPRTASYMVRARDDFGDAVAALPEELQAIFESDVYPRFGG